MENIEEKSTTCKGIINPNGTILIITPSELGAAHLHTCKNGNNKAFRYILPQEWHYKHRKYCNNEEPILVDVPNEEIIKIENFIIEKIDFNIRIEKNHYIYGTDYVVKQPYFKYEVHRLIIGDDFRGENSLGLKDRKEFSIEKYKMEKVDFTKKTTEPKIKIIGEKVKRTRTPRSEKFSNDRFQGRRFQ